MSFFGKFTGTRARASFERSADIGAHGVNATNETAIGFDAERRAMAVFDLHVATIANKMSVGFGCVVHAVVIDPEDTNVFRKRGKAAGAAKKAIGGNGLGHEGNYGQGVGQLPPQSAPISSPFCTASSHLGSIQTPARQTPL